ncbi:winged helix-turn-helix domain-containing protein, partial [Mesomycoplasma ovipneumoniae]|uniref:winged helix-turn-helix domain-containing protein n=1 Tax=Mesomycoplasma ovipneumoniae TaxID=29562 RepID=UPI003CC9F531
VWDSTGNYVNDNTLTVTMKRLREKLGGPTCLKTVRSFGYRMGDTKWSKEEKRHFCLCSPWSSSCWE